LHRHIVRADFAHHAFDAGPGVFRDRPDTRQEFLSAIGFGNRSMAVP